MEEEDHVVKVEAIALVGVVVVVVVIMITRRTPSGIERTLLILIILDLRLHVVPMFTAVGEIVWKKER